MNKIAKMFDEHHKLIAKGWEVRMLDKDTCREYLAQIPYYEGDKDLIHYQ